MHLARPRLGSMTARYNIWKRTAPDPKLPYSLASAKLNGYPFGSADGYLGISKDFNPFSVGKISTPPAAACYLDPASALLCDTPVLRFPSNSCS